MNATYKSRVWHLRPIGLAAALLATIALAGCQSPMYSGTPDDMSESIAPAYAPGTYEPPAKVGGMDEATGEAEPATTAETGAGSRYEYSCGRDPVTGRAKAQM